MEPGRVAEVVQAGENMMNLKTCADQAAKILSAEPRFADFESDPICNLDRIQIVWI